MSKIGRSSKSGRFVTVKTAKARPATHVVEKVGRSAGASGKQKHPSATLHDARTGQVYGLKGYGELRSETKVKKGLNPAKPVAEQVRK